MNIDELKQIIKLAKKEGITHLKFEGVELVISEGSLKPKKISKADLDEQLKFEKQDEMAALLWSVQDLDPLKEAN